MNTRLLATALAAILVVSGPALAASTMSSAATAGSAKSSPTSTTSKPAAKAHFYIAQTPGAKGCSIVSKRPDGKTTTMVGKYYYASQAAAQAAEKRLAVCKG